MGLNRGLLAKKLVFVAKLFCELTLSEVEGWQSQSTIIKKGLQG